MKTTHFLVDCLLVASWSAARWSASRCGQIGATYGPSAPSPHGLRTRVPRIRGAVPMMEKQARKSSCGDDVRFSIFFGLPVEELFSSTCGNAKQRDTTRQCNYIIYSQATLLAAGRRTLELLLEIHCLNHTRIFTSPCRTSLTVSVTITLAKVDGRWVTRLPKRKLCRLWWIEKLCKDGEGGEDGGNPIFPRCLKR